MSLAAPKQEASGRICASVATAAVLTSCRQWCPSKAVADCMRQSSNSGMSVLSSSDSRTSSLISPSRCQIYCSFDRVATTALTDGSDIVLRMLKES
uniref:Secreted protein n=1 Tax=Peronospora matthiolae TaxID=2874970 RepID=A0AAV1USN7_9STRA